MKFKITKYDILNGKQGSVSGCPIARSIKRTFKAKGVDMRRVSVEVSGVELYVTKVDKHGETKPIIEAFMPDKGTDFVSKFDSGKVVKPFTLVVSTR